MLVDLSQEFSEEMPYSSKFPAPTIEPIRDVETDGINVQQYSANTHLGTHLDAPRHFVPDGSTIEELSLDRVSGTGVVMDVAKESPEAITIADVKESSNTVREDDIVVLYTGWEDKYGTEVYEPHPWITVDLAEWFVDRGINLLALDVLTPDIPWSHRPDDWNEFPVHRELLGNGVLVAENLGNLSSLTGERVDVSGLPIKIRGADGAPARFVAKK
jgi:kynurenine formamidase